MGQLRSGFGAAAIVVALLLAGCGEQTPSTDIIAQTPVDPCAAGGDPFVLSVICATDSLAQLDAAVRETLAAETAADPVMAVAAIEEHGRWLDAQRIACGMPVNLAPTPEQVTCLESRLRERVTLAQTAVEQSGPYLFRRVEDVSASEVTAAAAAASGLGEMAPMAITRDIRYPQIGGEQTPQIRRFNELVRQEPRFRLEDQTSETVNYSISFAGPDIISVKFEIYDEPLSAPHGSVELRAVTVNMRSGAILSAGDVFRAGSGWEAFLTRRAMVELARAFEGTDFVPGEADVRETVTKPPQWLVTEQALVILFPPLSFAGPQIDGGQEVAISWADLRPYLNPQAPRPIGNPA